MAKYTKELNSICVECGNERAVNEYGCCSDCMAKPDKQYDYSPIEIHPNGYADKHRPKWHSKVKF